MQYIKKILELVSSLGTPSFHSQLGELIKTETKSTKVVFIRYIEDMFIIFDAQGVVPKKLEYINLDEAVQEFDQLNMFEFSFNTYILCDGEFEDYEIIELLNRSFEKEEDLYEKNRLETVIDRLSYQLSAIKELVLSLSEPLNEESFIEIVQSTISELLFSSAITYKVNAMKANKISNIGYIDLDIDSIKMDEILISSIEMKYALIMEDIQELEYLKEKKVKSIIPIGELDNEAYLIMVIRDTKIDPEEKLFVEAIFRIIQHFYIKQFVELIDFKEQITMKTLRILQVFDNLLDIVKNPVNLEKKFIETINYLSEVHNVSSRKLAHDLPVGVYSNREINDIDCDMMIVYTCEENSSNMKEICINISENHKENYLELLNIITLILESYETVLESKK